MTYTVSSGMLNSTTPYTTNPLGMSYHAKFDCCWSNGTSAHKEICQKNGLLTTSLSESLNVIRTDADQSGTYDFLSKFHSSHGPNKAYLVPFLRYMAKICQFFEPTFT